MSIPTTPVRAPASALRASLTPSSPPTPISELSPVLPALSSVTGTISLLWPYSTASGIPSLTLMVADLDPLKRLNKGRVKIRFVKRLAQMLREAKVGIADEVKVSLDGAKWEREVVVGERDVGWIIEVGGNGGFVEVTKGKEEPKQIEVKPEEAEVLSEKQTMRYNAGSLQLVTVPESPKTPSSPSTRPSVSSPLRRSSGNTHNIHNFQPGVTTKYSDYPPLSAIRFNATVDLMGIVTRAKPPAQARTGPKDFILSFRIVDSSSLKGVAITIARPNKRALPTIATPPSDDPDGESEENVTAILLRNFRIESFKREIVAVSGKHSSWAVWRGLSAEEGKNIKAEVSGPPVEMGSEEEAYVHALGRWFWSLSSETRRELGKVRKWQG